MSKYGVTVARKPPKLFDWVRFLVLGPLLFLTACTTFNLNRPNVPYEVEAVNTAVNAAVQYKKDKNDHWQTPEETRLLGTGDCEDYAIFKAELLPRYQKRIVVVYVKGDEKEGQHAILEVFLDNTSIFLDNRYDVFLTREEFHKIYKVHFRFPMEMMYKKDLLR